MNDLTLVIYRMGSLNIREQRSSSNPIACQLALIHRFDGHKVMQSYNICHK
jgi:hypothetical protein